MNNKQKAMLEYLCGLFSRAKERGLRIDPLGAREQRLLGLTKTEVATALDCQHVFLPEPKPLTGESECA